MTDHLIFYVGPILATPPFRDSPSVTFDRLEFPSVERMVPGVDENPAPQLSAALRTTTGVLSRSSSIPDEKPMLFSQPFAIRVPKWGGTATIYVEEQADYTPVGDGCNLIFTVEDTDRSVEWVADSQQKA